MEVAQEPLASDHDRAHINAARELSRVFLMINSFETGGSERQFASLANALDRQHFSVDLGCIQSKGPLLAQFGEVPRFKLGGSIYGWRSWQSRRRLAQLLREKAIQIAHAFDFYTNLTLVPAARWSRVPVIIGSHRQLGDLLTSAQRRVQRMAFRYCDAIVCNSQAAADRLKTEGVPGSKLRVIGNAIAIDSFADAAPLIPREPGVLRIGMIARMNALDKNHRGFLQTAAQLHQKFPRAEFFLAGDGPLRAQFEAEVATLGIAENVRFLGDRHDIPAVLASIDITIVPSDSESLSNVVLESMAASVPVIATRVGGNPELLGNDRGLLVPPKDVDALVSAATHLIESRELRSRFAIASREFVCAKFSAESITRQYETLYDGLLREKKRSSVVSQSATSLRPRVAIVGPSLRYVGGQAVQADLLLKHWTGDRDASVGFIAVDPLFLPGLRWAEGIPGLRTVIRMPLYFAALWGGLNHADIAHAFSASYSSFLLAPLPAYIVARLRGKKVVINYRSGEARDHLRGSAIARAVLKRVDRVVAPSGYLVDVFREFEINAAVVPNIVDLSQFAFRERKLPPRPHLVCTRGFHPYYCVDVVVKAFAIVQQEFPTAQLDLVGGGPLEADIRQLVVDLKLRNVNFCGVASRSEIGKCYDRADIFINASRLDNMPVSVLEAYASGTPVITTAPESMKYVVEDGVSGLLSPVGDPQALAANVIRVLRDAALAGRLIAGGLERMREYRWEVVRERWLAIYNSLNNAS